MCLGCIHSQLDQQGPWWACTETGPFPKKENTVQNTKIFFLEQSAAKCNLRSTHNTELHHSSAKKLWIFSYFGFKINLSIYFSLLASFDMFVNCKGSQLFATVE